MGMKIRCPATRFRKLLIDAAVLIGPAVDAGLAPRIGTTAACSLAGVI